MSFLFSQPPPSPKSFLFLQSRRPPQFFFFFISSRDATVKHSLEAFFFFFFTLSSSLILGRFLFLFLLLWNLELPLDPSSFLTQKNSVNDSSPNSKSSTRSRRLHHHLYHSRSQPQRNSEPPGRRRLWTSQQCHKRFLHCGLLCQIRWIRWYSCYSSHL